LVAAALAALGDPPLDALQLAAAATIAGQHHPHLDPGRPALLLAAADSLVPQLAAVLLQAYPTNHPVTLLRGPDVERRALADLASAPAPVTAIYLPPVAVPAAYEALQDVVAQLRSPAGCPWDRDLTWPKLRASLLEETHELLAVLDADDPGKVQEELGDLLLQVALITQIATECGCFRFPDVVAMIVAKLIRRHPHVFGGATVRDTADVLANWEAIKRAERERNGERRSPLAGIPQGLPALAQADAYLDRMSRLRSETPPAAPWPRLAALPADQTPPPDLVGDVLFDLVAWARTHGVDAESALRAANARYAAQVDEA
jgi:tetrapyrrole methylase family protein/MazG family protein